LDENIRLSLEVSFFLNATENEQNSIKQIGEYVGTNIFSKVDVDGYYGNLMHIVTMSITESQTDATLGKILKSISEKDMGIIMASLSSSTDKDGNLHIRIDKQSILEGSIKLSQRDPLKIKIIPRLTKPISLDWVKWYSQRLEDLRKQYRD